MSTCTWQEGDAARSSQSTLGVAIKSLPTACAAACGAVPATSLAPCLAVRCAGGGGAARRSALCALPVLAPSPLRHGALPRRESLLFASLFSTRSPPLATRQIVCHVSETPSNYTPFPSQREPVYPSTNRDQQPSRALSACRGDRQTGLRLGHREVVPLSAKKQGRRRRLCSTMGFAQCHMGSGASLLEMVPGVQAETLAWRCRPDYLGLSRRSISPVQQASQDMTDGVSALARAGLTAHVCCA